MQTKLTLRLDDSLIERAKAFAVMHERSLSQLVADYFAALTPVAAPLDENADAQWLQQLAPQVRAMVGIAKPAPGKSIPSDDDAQSDYSDHLRRKHTQHWNSVPDTLK